MLQQVEQLDISLEAMILGVGQREACGSCDKECGLRGSELHQRTPQGRGPRSNCEPVFSWCSPLDCRSNRNTEQVAS